MIYRFGDFTLDRERYRLERSGEAVHIEPLAVDLVAYLLERRDRLVPREELLEALWTDRFVSDAVLARCVREARRALGDDAEQQTFIKTVRGRGYGFAAEVEDVDEATERQGTPSKPSASPDDKETPAWEPAIGVAIPNRPHWSLERKLGDGGFGSVWLAQHEKTRAKRIFKFCFDPERLRALEREVVLFRLLEASLGERDDIAQVLDWQFDELPYFLEAAYTPGGDLADWAEAQRGLAAVPLATRLELVAEAAVALGAAHSAGVLHKDVKPSNILIREHPESGEPRASLTDFGIGLLTDRDLVRQKGITAPGLTDILVRKSGDTSGTRLYMAPEILAGRAPTVQSDLYSLGVVLYQAVRGDFTAVLAPGWEREIDDTLLREDIAACVDGDPARRLPSAAELARRLRTLASRRRERALAERARRRRRRLSVALPASAVLIVVASLLGWREMRLRQQAESAQYVSAMQLAGTHLENGKRAQARDVLLQAPAGERAWEWGALVNEAWPAAQETNRTEVAEIPAGTTAAEMWRGASAVVVATLRQPARHLILLNRDGSRLLYNTDDGLLVRDLETGVVAASWFIMPADWPVALSHDERLLATTGTDFALWNVAAEEKIESLPHLAGIVLTASFSRDDSLLATWAPGTLRLWEVASRQLLWQTPLPRPDNSFPDLRFSGDGSCIAATTGARGIATWSVASGQPISSVAGPGEGGLTSLRLSPDLERVVSVGGDRVSSDRLVLWNAETGDLVAVEEPRPEEGPLRRPGLGRGMFELQDVHRTAFSADSTAFAFVDQDGTLRLLDARSGALLTVLSTVLDSDASIAWSADGTRIAASQLDGTLRVLAPAGRRPPGTHLLPAHRDAVRRIAWSADGSRLLTTSYDGTAAVWDVRTHERQVVLHNGALIWGAEISPDGRLVWTFDGERTHRLWNAETGEERFSRPGSLSYFAGSGPAGAPGPRAPMILFSGGLTSSRGRFSPAGDRVLLVIEGNTEVVATDTGETLITVLGDSSEYSPDGAYIVTVARWTTEVKVWSASNGELLNTLERPDCCGFGRLEISPDSTRLANGSGTGIVRVWELETGALLLELPPHAGNAILARFSPDGRALLTASFDRTAKLWDAETGELLATMRGPDALNDADFSPDGTRIFTLFRARSKLSLWDLAGRELTTLTTPSPILNVAWSPDGSTLAASQLDGGVRLWESVPWAELAAIGDGGDGRDGEDSGDRSISLEERLRRWRGGER